MSTLSRSALRRVYDRVGAWQDTQRVYEAPALDALAAHGRFGEVHALFELGCGTGRFAARLLRHRLPPSACYCGTDLSATMVARARNRLAPFAHRASVRHTDGRLAIPAARGAYDGVLTTYVLDLLPPADIRRFVAEAHRVLSEGGRLYVAGLTQGTTPLTRATSWLWQQVHRQAPTLVGGCRPLDTRPYLAPTQWRVAHRSVVSGAALSSEVLIAVAL